MDCVGSFSCVPPFFLSIILIVLLNTVFIAITDFPLFVLITPRIIVLVRLAVRIFHILPHIAISVTVRPEWRFLCLN